MRGHLQEIGAMTQSSHGIAPLVVEQLVKKSLHERFGALLQVEVKRKGNQAVQGLLPQLPRKVE